MGLKFGADGNGTRADWKRIIEDIERVKAGEFVFIPDDEYDDKEFVRAINSLTEVAMRRANDPAIRINSALAEASGDTITNDMLIEVEKQTQYIDNLERSGVDLENANKNIASVMNDVKEYAQNVIRLSAESANNLGGSITSVQSSVAEIDSINERMQHFKEKIDEISNIVALVKSIASKSNLLALNASIEAARAGEAGKGFAVVAGEVKALAENTTSSTEEITKTVTELQKMIEQLAESMHQTSDTLKNETDNVRKASEAIGQSNSQMASISDKINNAYAYIGDSSLTVRRFLEALGHINASYDSLRKSCNDVGKFIFDTIRSIDKPRGALTRDAALLSDAQRLAVFEVDHIIFTWRLRMASERYEKLSLDSLKNYKGCKMGKWIAGIQDPRILEIPAFRKLNESHRLLHEKAVEVYEALERNDIDLTRKKAAEADDILQDVLDQLHSLQKHSAFK